MCMYSSAKRLQMKTVSFWWARVGLIVRTKQNIAEWKSAWSPIDHCTIKVRGWPFNGENQSNIHLYCGLMLISYIKYYDRKRSIKSEYPLRTITLEFIRRCIYYSNVHATSCTWSHWNEAAMFSDNCKDHRYGKKHHQNGTSFLHSRCLLVSFSLPTTSRVGVILTAGGIRSNLP